jgi:hypothetical protein
MHRTAYQLTHINAIKNRNRNTYSFFTQKIKTMKQKNTKLLAMILFCAAAFSSNAQSWLLNGNAGTNGNIHFVGTTDNKPLSFRTNNKERMRILPGGKIGIGTTSPDARFTVAVGGAVTLSTTDSFLLGSISGSNLAFDNNEIQARYNGSGSTLYLNYWGGAMWMGNHSGTISPGIYIGSDGAVGVGSSATNSSYALAVNPGYAGNGILFNDPVNGYMAFGAKTGSGIGMLIENTSSTNTSPALYGFNSGPGYGVYGYTAGGTGSDPFYPSGVYGYNGSYGYGTGGYCYNGSGVLGYSANYVGVWGSTGNSSSYAGYFAGNVYSTGSYQGSDQKLKQNIKDVTRAMDIITQLRPKTYDFRQDGNYKLMNLPQGTHYGLIAQEVEKILPTLVKDTKFETALAKAPGKVGADGKMEGGSGGKSETIDFKALNYTELIPIMIKGMQELQQKVTDLENTIASMKQKSVSSVASNDAVTKTTIAAYLKQNAPNPFTQNTSIQCYLPETTHQAQLIIYSMDGHQVKSFTLNNGMNQVTINAGVLPAGQYMYSLVVDGAKVDTKNMMLTK